MNLIWLLQYGTIEAMKKISFLGIGDITTDAFIRLKEAEVIGKNTRAPKLCLDFATKVPFESVTVVKGVGNSANAAVCASRLNLDSYLLSNVGKDQNGKECIASMKKNGVNTKYMAVEKGKATNYHYVLWYGDDRTILIKQIEYAYALPKMKSPDWIYLSSVGSNGYQYHVEIAEYLKKNPGTKLIFQPGTYQMKLGTEKLKDIYAQTEIFVCNVEEAQRILNMPTAGVEQLLGKMHELGPKIVSITDGPNGAYASDGTTAYFMPIYPDPKPPLERTGCGDSFTTTLSVAIALGKSLEEALLWAPINPMSVVQYVGAQEGLLTREKLLYYLANAPKDYKPRVL